MFQVGAQAVGGVGAEAGVERGVGGAPDGQDLFQRGAAGEGTDKMMKDPRMADMPKEAPFDGMRMMWGGFEPLVTFEA